MPTHVTDSRSNANDQIDHAVKAIGRSPDRLAVFEAIYYGKQAWKTPADVAKRTRMKRKRVLEEAIKLFKAQVILKERHAGKGLVYGMDSFYQGRRDQIVSLVKDPKKLSRLPTKVRPQGTANPIRITVARNQVRAKMVSVDEIDSFAEVKKAKANGVGSIPEKWFKYGVAHVLGDKGKFTDWGGERNDLYTTNVRVRGKRIAAAFAFKGPATTGVLTPKKMGRNGDQIQRLFLSPASLFMVQYGGQIDQSVVEQMKVFAQVKSLHDGTNVLFGIIDAADSGRLVRAYPTKFKMKKKKKEGK